MSVHLHVGFIMVFTQNSVQEFFETFESNFNYFDNTTCFYFFTGCSSEIEVPRSPRNAYAEN